MFLNGMFQEPVEDAALYYDAIILKLATDYGWLPSEVAKMPIEWVFKTLEFSAAKNQVKEIRRGAKKG